MQYLKWAIILIVVYYLYTRFISKEKYTLVSDHPIEPVVTSKSLLKPGIFYRKGILKSGIRNTLNGPLNEGQTCAEFPPEIYIPVSPQNATCDLSDSAVYDTGVAVSAETRANCPNNMKTINKKSAILLNTLVASGGATRTVAINGGTDCATQAASLPATKTRACTNPIAAECNLTKSAVYDTGVAVSAETRANCPNNMKTINKKSATLLNTLVASGGATRTVAINGGTDCATQAASLPATDTTNCTNPIPAECISNVNSNYTVDTSVTQVGSYWSAL